MLKHKKSAIGVNEAILGLVYTFRTQANFRTQLIVAISAVLLGLICQIKAQEWVSLLLVISLVLVAEVTNTALEATVDLTVSDLNPIAKIVKDAAAGAVLVASVFAVVIGILIFFPYLFLTTS